MDEQVFRAILDASNDTYEGVRLEAARALGKTTESRGCVEDLMPLLQDCSFQVRRVMAESVWKACREGELSQLLERLEYLLEHESYPEVREALRSSRDQVERALYSVRPKSKEEPLRCPAMASLPDCPSMGEMIEVKEEEEEGGEGARASLLYAHVVDLDMSGRRMGLRISHRGLADGKIVAVGKEEKFLSFSVPWREATADPWSRKARWPSRGYFVTMRGETSFWIAKEMRMSLDSIFQLNQQLDCSTPHLALPDMSVVMLDREASELEVEPMNGGLLRLIEEGIRRGEGGAMDVLLRYPDVESQGSVSAMVSLLHDALAPIRERALLTVKKLAKPKSLNSYKLIPHVMDNLEHVSAAVRRSAEEAITALVDQDSCPLYVMDRVVLLCTSTDQDLKATGLRCLGRLSNEGQQRILDIIVDGVLSDHKLVHDAAIEAVRRRNMSAALFEQVTRRLVSCKGTRDVEALVRAVDQFDLEERTEEIVHILSGLARSSDDFDRLKFVSVCSLLVNKASCPFPLTDLLLLLSKDSHETVKEAAAQLLHRTMQRKKKGPGAREEQGGGGKQGGQEAEEAAALRYSSASNHGEEVDFDHSLLLRNRRDPDNDPQERRWEEKVMRESCHGVACSHRTRTMQEMFGELSEEDVRDPFPVFTLRIVKQLRTDISQQRRRRLVDSLRSLSLLCGFRGFRAAALSVDLLLGCDHADARVSGAQACSALMQRPINMRCALAPIKQKLLLLLLDGDQLVRHAVLAVLPDVFARGSEDAMSVLFGQGGGRQEGQASSCLLAQLELSRSRGRAADVETLTHALGALAPVNDSSSLTVLLELVKEEASPVRLSALLSIRRLFVRGERSQLDQLVLSVALACRKQEEDRQVRLVAEDLLRLLGGEERAYRVASRAVPWEEERDVRFSVDRDPLRVMGMDLVEYREEEEERTGCEEVEE
ncbi:hypothetical protein GUITHDRAFT_103544 [Guillardia theta CCMP2712]|uniref:Uncharacterized protein n=1 Tax=Guillardia theta (strain CCMP2712) TaxID=905079 RepID=L1JR89_GUITC|nr:hypothetical protein GUITHDRAFT_103544 [Guillardia theta CCMP2712]EKX50962.1 hypothetical protein GUITHDRAFT_103544 [Guillardia theta CCMP2712]|eukprot:XP_005837942.1 hypothetical protein GUITHDRAFT_103544 [Guillardia theta CCMP2712]